MGAQVAPTFAGSPPYAISKVNMFTAAYFTRNSDIWTGNLNTTCIPPFAPSLHTKNGVLVTTQDMIFAHHLLPSIGTVLTFVDMDGVSSTRTVAASRLLSGPVSDGGDIQVISLNLPVAAGITPAKVLPANFRTYLPNPGPVAYPCLFTNQDHTLLIGDYLWQDTTYGSFIGRSTDANRSPWHYEVRPEDSGAPAFMLINGQLVVLCCWHYAGAWGPTIADNITQINAAMALNAAEVGFTANTLTPVDLSGFTA